MKAVPPKGCRTKLNNRFPNLSALVLLPRNAYFLPVRANSPPSVIPSFLLVIQPLDFILYKILPVYNTRMTADSLFLHKASLISIYLLLKLPQTFCYNSTMHSSSNCYVTTLVCISISVSIIWYNYLFMGSHVPYLIKKLKCLQNRAIRAVVGAHFRDSINPYYSQL